MDGDVSCFPIEGLFCHHWCWKKSCSENSESTHLSRLDTDFNQSFHDIESKSEKTGLGQEPLSVWMKAVAAAFVDDCREIWWICPLTKDGTLLKSHWQSFDVTLKRNILSWENVHRMNFCPVGSAYMCQVTFSALTHIKPGWMRTAECLVTAVVTLPPRTIKAKQTCPSVSLKLRWLMKRSRNCHWVSLNIISFTHV